MRHSGAAAGMQGQQQYGVQHGFSGGMGAGHMGMQAGGQGGLNQLAMQQQQAYSQQGRSQVCFTLKQIRFITFHSK